MAEMAVLSPMLETQQNANIERAQNLNQPQTSRRRYIATQIYALFSMIIVCVTTIIITLVKVEEVQNYLFGNCTRTPIQIQPNETFLSQFLSLNLTCH